MSLLPGKPDFCAYSEGAEAGRMRQLFAKGRLPEMNKLLTFDEFSQEQTSLQPIVERAVDMMATQSL